VVGDPTRERALRGEYGGHMSKRSTKEQVDSRVHQCYVWLIEGADPTTIIQSGVGLWGVTSHTVRKYLKRARALLAEAAATERTHELGRVLARNERLYREAWKKATGKDRPQSQMLWLCRALNRDRAELLGLNEPTEVMVTGNGLGRPLADKSTEELVGLVTKADAVLRRAGRDTPTRPN